MINRFFIYLIKIYQILISPLLPSRCRFYPTCSDFFIDALKKEGILGGFYCGLRRISRCHPFNPGGIDFIDNYERDKVLIFIRSLNNKYVLCKGGITASAFRRR